MSYRFDIRVPLPNLSQTPQSIPLFRDAYRDTIDNVRRLDAHNPIELTAGTGSLNLQSDCFATPLLGNIIEEMGQQFKRYGHSSIYTNLNDQLALARAIILENADFSTAPRKTPKAAFLSARVLFPIPIRDFSLRQEESFAVSKSVLEDRDLVISDRVENLPKAVEVSSTDRDRYMVGKLVMHWTATQIGHERKITRSAARNYYEDAKFHTLGRSRASELKYARG